MKKMKHAAAYKDVVAVLGNDEEALYQHYLTYGLKEGRNASIYFNHRNIERPMVTWMRLLATIGRSMLSTMLPLD